MMQDRLAWQAYEDGDFEQAALIWENLIANCKEDCNDLKLAFGYTLVKLGRHNEARELYKNLYRETQLHIYLHQLGMVEREAGNLSLAREIYQQETVNIEPSNYLGLAANLYELGLIEHMLGNQVRALEFANQCLAYSHKTIDFVMLGCAYRLLGDLISFSNTDLAKLNYSNAQSAFLKANDAMAVKEVELKLQLLT